MSEKTSKGTSGQSVPKSKFRHKSRQEQAAESKLRMEKRGEKLDKARGKLAKQKPPKRPGPVKRAGRAALGGVQDVYKRQLLLSALASACGALSICWRATARTIPVARARA